MPFDTEMYTKCKRMLDAAISHDVVLGEQGKWAALCENGILGSLWHMHKHMLPKYHPGTHGYIILCII